MLQKRPVWLGLNGFYDGQTPGREYGKCSGEFVPGIFTPFGKWMEVSLIRI
ncbi:hypothetical protein [Salegentibacter sp. 24]|uniref:hypothetical protein n=1 Tax=Salegentibacter sp. 24 TaxID=2183986 RepID=UPI001414DB40|nr:hypothetical protein [Salegentibacter sp. 24]